MIGLGKITPGSVSPLVTSASAVNDVLEAARKARAQRLGPAGGGSSTDPIGAQTRILIRNDTGADLDARSVVAVGDPIISAVDHPHEVRRGAAFEGLDPDGSSVFAITDGAVKDGEFGRATLVGVAVVDIDVSDAGHEYATDTASDPTQLESATSGPARILWKESGTGVKRAAVLLLGGTAGTGGSSSVSAWKEPVRVATTANGTLSTAFENGDTVDGVTLATGDRILIKNQTTASENGIYTVNASGAPTRATDADAASELLGAVVFVSEGTVYADSVWACTNNAAIVVGTTGLTWVRIFYRNYLESVLGSDYTITSASTWENTGMSVTIPAGSGDWEISANVAAGVGSLFGADSIYFRVYDSTNSAVVGYAQIAVNRLDDGSNTAGVGSGFLQTKYTAGTSNATLRVEAYALISGSSPTHVVHGNTSGFTHSRLSARPL